MPTWNAGDHVWIPIQDSSALGCLLIHTHARHDKLPKKRMFIVHIEISTEEGKYTTDLYNKRQTFKFIFLTWIVTYPQH